MAHVTLRQLQKCITDLETVNQEGSLLEQITHCGERFITHTCTGTSADRHHNKYIVSIGDHLEGMHHGKKIKRPRKSEQFILTLNPCTMESWQLNCLFNQVTCCNQATCRTIKFVIDHIISDVIYTYYKITSSFY